ncbi:urea transporter [Paraburkholderia sp. PREW-6R]|uniref:urea transporter n=1 Tax=Paraburkholderia sp. PREW-6R TaxID=3141544 RepID=UPI0031F5601E
MHAAATEAQSAALRTLLRSLGQIVLQPNAFTGACLLAAWLIHDPRLACAALIGAVAANVSATLAGYDGHDTRAGLHGFNGALAGLAAFVNISDNTTAVAVAILAATGTAWLLQPWSQRLRKHGLGYFSSPCLLVTWLWLAFAAFTVQTPGVEAAQHFSAERASAGVLAGLAQTGFASSAYSGLLVLVGIAASSRKHALWALLGAALASAAQLLLGATASSFDTGLLGFNGALTALALADGSAATTLAGVGLSVALQALAVQFGLPAMTAPFVLATWSIQLYRQPMASTTAATEAVERGDNARRSNASVRASEAGR